MPNPPLNLRERACVEADCCKQYTSCWTYDNYSDGPNRCYVCALGTFCFPCVYSAAWEQIHHWQFKENKSWYPVTPTGCLAMLLLCTHDYALPFFGSYIRTHNTAKRASLISEKQCWYLFVACLPCWFCGPCEMANQVLLYDENAEHGEQILDSS